VKATPVTGPGLGLVSVIVMSELEPAKIGFGLNALAADTVVLPAVRTAVAVLVLLPPLVVVRSPGFNVLV